MVKHPFQKKGEQKINGLKGKPTLNLQLGIGGIKNNK